MTQPPDDRPIADIPALVAADIERKLEAVRRTPELWELRPVPYENDGIEADADWAALARLVWSVAALLVFLAAAVIGFPIWLWFR